MTTHHHHIVTYYMYLAKLVAHGRTFHTFTEQYYLGRAFLYTDFN